MNAKGKQTQYYERYQNMSAEEQERNYLVLDLDMAIGGKPDLLLELLSFLDFGTGEPSLTLKRIMEDLEHELGMGE